MTRTDARTITLQRTLPAPLPAVWSAWSDPAKLSLWWGPRGFTCRTHQIDLRDGGQWRFDMIAPDGTVYANRHQFRRIAPMHSIDYHCDDDGTADHAFDAEVRFSQVGDATHVSLTLIFPDAATRAMVEKFGAVAHGYTTLDCLTEAAAPDTLSLTRILDADCPRVWECWTRPDQMAHWFFPADMIVASASFEPLKRGAWRTVMQDPASGTTLTVQGNFQTVDAPHRLVFTHGWEDADGHVATLTRVTITLHDMSGKTRLSLVQKGLASQASRDGHRGGWTERLDHLAAHLKNP